MRPPKSMRLVEVILWVLGFTLLGAAFGETVDRRNYQAEQERALAIVRGPAILVEEPETPVEAVAPPAIVPRAPRKKAAPLDPNVIGRIEIPRLRLKAIVREGTDERTLRRAVGRLPVSARPGEIGNLVLAGHRDTFFRPLERIRVNDRIRLVTRDETYEYRVASTGVVPPEQTSVLASREVEELTLVTCYPFWFVGPAPERFIVSAARVD